MKPRVFILLLALSVFLALTATTQPGPTFKVNPDKCISCNRCVYRCPVKAITMVKGKAVIDSTKCINCGLCYRVCPTRAIQLIPADSLAVDSLKTDSTKDIPRR